MLIAMEKLAIVQHQGILHYPLFEEGVIGLKFIVLSMEIFGLEMIHH
jgi:hypothetical protein